MSNTIESIEQGNKLIAEFMGGKCEYDAHIGWIKNVEGLPLWEMPNDRFHLEQGKYHTSWDWLMAVVEKIETLVIKTNITSNCVIIRVNEDELNTDDVVVSYRGIMSKIEAVWQAAVQFIEWYNNQKSNQ